MTCASLAVQGSPDLFRQHVPLFLPGVFDRLGDLKAPVREGARNLLVSLMELRVTPPSDVFGKASIGWRHKNWRVREELLRTCEQAFASDALSPEDLSVKATLPQVLNALEDREPGVREAAVSAILGASMRTGPAIHGMLARHTIRPGQLREIQARLADANLGAGAVGGAVGQGAVGGGSIGRGRGRGRGRRRRRLGRTAAARDRRPGSNAGARARTGVGSPSENAERRPTSTSSTGSGGRRGAGRGGFARFHPRRRLLVVVVDASTEHDGRAGVHRATDRARRRGGGAGHRRLGRAPALRRGDRTGHSHRGRGLARAGECRLGEGTVERD